MNPTGSTRHPGLDPGSISKPEPTARVEAWTLKQVQGDDRALQEAARQFEAIFLRQMIAAMRAPSLGDELFGSDAANQFRDMSDARLADSMAGEFGIARMLEKQFAR